MRPSKVKIGLYPHELEKLYRTYRIHFEMFHNRDHTPLDMTVTLAEHFLRVESVYRGSLLRQCPKKGFSISLPASNAIALYKLFQQAGDPVTQIILAKIDCALLNMNLRPKGHITLF